MLTLSEFHPDAPPARGLRGELFAEVFAYEAHRPARADEIETYLCEDRGADLVAPDGMFLLALLDGGAIGCAGLRHHGVDVPDDAAEIKRMFVRPSARGRGLGGLLLERLLADARAAGHRRVVLDTRDELTNAIGLYRRHGFVPRSPYNVNPSATSWWERPIPPGRGVT